MSDRIFNFNPGPAALPVQAIQRAQEELLSYKGSGISILETSHRSPEFSQLMDDVEKNFRDLLGIPDSFTILFLGGGANLQFYMVPLNLLEDGKTADYINTGTWSDRAIKEAQKIGAVNIAASTKKENYSRIPAQDELNLTPGASYVHITSNNTIFGTQWKELPNTGGIPIVADMSSDILSRPIDFSSVGIVYAGAQKNLGPAGVTVVIIRKDLIGNAPSNSATMLDYKIHAEKNSLYNTPPVYAIYMIKLVLDWVKEEGGLEKITELNKQKAGLLYNAIDESNGFYKGTVSIDSRSMMNVTYHLKTEEYEKAFLKEAVSFGLKGLKGHRSVGGIRASIYNAVPLAAVEKLVEFMKTFKEKNM